MSTNSYLSNGLFLKLFYNSNIRQISYEDIIKERQKNVILHSYGIFNVKPWVDNQINPFNEVFMHYMNYVNKEYNCLFNYNEYNNFIEKYKENITNKFFNNDNSDYY